MAAAVQSYIAVFLTLQDPVFKECCSSDIFRVRIQLLSCHDLIFLRGTSCFLTFLLTQNLVVKVSISSH